MDIDGNKITGKIRYMDQEVEYKYTAPKSGIYRFDFDTDNVNLDYGFYLYDEKAKELVDSAYYYEGSTCELEKGKRYKILVTYKEGNPQYTISIGVPDGIKNIKGNAITGKIRYTDQANIYYYTAPKTGTYKFKLGINDVNQRYNFLLLSKKKEELANTSSEYNETTVELKRGEKYEIQVKQYSGFAKYNVKISF